MLVVEGAVDLILAIMGSIVIQELSQSQYFMIMLSNDECLDTVGLDMVVLDTVVLDTVVLDTVVLGTWVLDTVVLDMVVTMVDIVCG